MQFWHCPRWGICTLFLSPTLGFLYECLAPPWGICSFPKHNGKCPTNAVVAGGGWASLELTEP